MIRESHTFDVTPFNSARDDVRDLLTMPVQAWLVAPGARKTDAAYHDLLTVPKDLAAAGYLVSIAQPDDGWRIELRREISPGATLKLQGRARLRLGALPSGRLGRVGAGAAGEEIAPGEGTHA